MSTTTTTTTTTTDLASAALGAAAETKRMVVQHPYAAIGIAAGVGFVVAGGLVSPAARALAHIGARFAFAAATRKLGALVVEAALSAAPAENDDGPAPAAVVAGNHAATAAAMTSS